MGNTGPIGIADALYRNRHQPLAGRAVRKGPQSAASAATLHFGLTVRLGKTGFGCDGDCTVTCQNSCHHGHGTKKRKKTRRHSGHPSCVAPADPSQNPDRSGRVSIPRSYLRSKPIAPNSSAQLRDLCTGRRPEAWLKAYRARPDPAACDRPQKS